MDVPPVVVPVPAEQAQPSAEVVQDVELPQESQFSEDEPWKFGAFVATWVFLNEKKWVGVKLVKGRKKSYIVFIFTV